MEKNFTIEQMFCAFWETKEKYYKINKELYEMYNYNYKSCKLLAALSGVARGFTVPL
jgi:hypothetical protein